MLKTLPTWYSEVTPLQYKSGYTSHIVVDHLSPNATHEDAIIAVSRGMVLMLTNPLQDRTAGVTDALKEWSSGDIRKVVRRCSSNSKHWAAASIIADTLSVHRRAKVMVSTPQPNDATPKELSRLQARLDLPHQEGLPAESSVPGELVIALNPEFAMTTGKAAAQAAHIAHLAVLGATEEEIGAWADTAYTVSLANWEDLVSNHQFSIHDAGHTEIPADSWTAVGRFITEDYEEN